MKSVIMDGPRKSHVAEVPMPEMADDLILIRVKYTGLCHSDWYPWSVARPGEHFGHEVVGVVAEVGRDVTGFRVGDRVSCVGGGCCEYVTASPLRTVHIPDNVSDEDANVEPLGCLLSAVSKLPLTVPGDAVAVVGAGFMGLGAISLFKLRGAGRIVVVEPRAEARENALRFGATEVYAPDDLPPSYRLNLDNWADVDIFHTGFANVLEFSGVESALQLAGEMVCAHGHLGIGGYHNDGMRTIDYKLWNLKGMTAINCHERRMEYAMHCCQNAMDLLSSGRWPFYGANTNFYEMDQFDQAYADMERKPAGFIKGLMRC